MPRPSPAVPHKAKPEAPAHGEAETRPRREQGKALSRDGRTAGAEPEGARRRCPSRPFPPRRAARDRARPAHACRSRASGRPSTPAWRTERANGPLSHWRRIPAWRSRSRAAKSPRRLRNCQGRGVGAALSVMASEAKPSNGSCARTVINLQPARRGTVDCFASLAMTEHFEQM
jgi:hypothetical protein